MFQNFKSWQFNGHNNYWITHITTTSSRTWCQDWNSGGVTPRKTGERIQGLMLGIHYILIGSAGMGLKTKNNV